MPIRSSWRSFSLRAVWTSEATATSAPAAMASVTLAEWKLPDPVFLTAVTAPDGVTPMIRLLKRLQVESLLYLNKRRYFFRFGKLLCHSQKDPSNGTDFGILCFILPILSLYI